MKALFIGGTGQISSACARRTFDVGIDLYVLNRRQTSSRPLPDGVTVLTADIRDPQAVRNALAGHSFDVVVNWIGFTPDQVQADIERFQDRIGQYVFISSASAYQTPPERLPIIESTPLRNPVWGYSQAKIACEDLLVMAYRQRGFPVTIVRPSHTYDRTYVPLHGGWTVIDRMRRGEDVVVHGDGTSLWVLTHNTDFAKAFVGLLGAVQAVGDSFHITSDEVLTWNQIYEIMAKAAGVKAQLVHIPSAAIAAVDAEWGASLLGDKAYSKFFDNDKVRSVVPDFVATVPFSQGAAEIIAWHDADPGRRTVDQTMNRTMDQLAEAFRPRSLDF